VKRASPIRRGAGSEAATSRSVHASEIERAILLRIARREYAAGQQLPTCEALAAELGANKNTVSKAYRSLAQRSYLQTRPGQGTFVCQRPVRLDTERSRDGIVGLLSLAIQEAKLSGLRPAQFQSLVDDVVAQGYGRRGPRLGFVECNRHDATTLSRDLQVALFHPVEPLLLNDVVGDPERFMRDFDVLAVNLTHLAVVESAIGSVDGEAAATRIVGMHIPIDPDSLLQVARLRAGTHVGVICDLKQTLLSMSGMVRGCNPGLHVDGCLAEEAAAVQGLVAWSDLMLVTPSALDHVHLDQSHVSVITPKFRPDARSLEQLSDLIAEQRVSEAGRNDTGAFRRLTPVRAAQLGCPPETVGSGPGKGLAEAGGKL
jgi:GntR family transcriptional regulator